MGNYYFSLFKWNQALYQCSSGSSNNSEECAKPYTRFLQSVISMKL